MGQPDPKMDQVMIRMREKIRDRREKPVISASSTERIMRDLAVLEASSSAFIIRFTSHRKLLMPVVTLTKRLLRRLLTPILTQQGLYNETNARVGRHLLARLESLNQDQTDFTQCKDP